MLTSKPRRTLVLGYASWCRLQHSRMWQCFGHCRLSYREGLGQSLEPTGQISSALAQRFLWILQIVQKTVYLAIFLKEICKHLWQTSPCQQTVLKVLLQLKETLAPMRQKRGGNGRCWRNKKWKSNRDGIGKFDEQRFNYMVDPRHERFVAKIKIESKWNQTTAH